MLPIPHCHLLSDTEGYIGQGQNLRGRNLKLIIGECIGHCRREEGDRIVKIQGRDDCRLLSKGWRRRRRKSKLTGNDEEKIKTRQKQGLHLLPKGYKLLLPELLHLLSKCWFPAYSAPAGHVFLAATSALLGVKISENIL